MMIDVTPLMPYLAVIEKAKADLASSAAEFAALSRSEQLAQVDSFLARDEATQKAHDEACRMIIAALRLAADSTPNPQLQVMQDTPEVIESARGLIAAMAGEIRRINARGSDTALLDKARETAAVSGHLSALQLHGLLSMEMYGELIAEKAAAARNAGA